MDGGKGGLSGSGEGDLEWLNEGEGDLEYCLLVIGDVIPRPLVQVDVEEFHKELKFGLVDVVLELVDPIDDMDGCLNLRGGSSPCNGGNGWLEGKLSMDGEGKGEMGG